MDYSPIYSPTTHLFHTHHFYFYIWTGFCSHPLPPITFQCVRSLVHFCTFALCHTTHTFGYLRYTSPVPFYPTFYHTHTVIDWTGLVGFVYLLRWFTRRWFIARLPCPVRCHLPRARFAACRTFARALPHHRALPYRNCLSFGILPRLRFFALFAVDVLRTHTFATRTRPLRLRFTCNTIYHHAYNTSPTVRTYHATISARTLHLACAAAPRFVYRTGRWTFTMRTLYLYLTCRYRWFPHTCHHALTVEHHPPAFGSRFWRGGQVGLWCILLCRPHAAAHQH